MGSGGRSAGVSLRSTGRGSPLRWRSRCSFFGLGYGILGRRNGPSLTSSEIKMKIKIKTVSEMGDGRSEMGGPPSREASEGLRREVEGGKVIYGYDYVYERKRRPVDGDGWGDRLRL